MISAFEVVLDDREITGMPQKIVVLRRWKWEACPRAVDCMCKYVSTLLGDEKG